MSAESPKSQFETGFIPQMNTENEWLRNYPESEQAISILSTRAEEAQNTYNDSLARKNAYVGIRQTQEEILIELHALQTPGKVLTPGEKIREQELLENFAGLRNNLEEIYRDLQPELVEGELQPSLDELLEEKTMLALGQVGQSMQALTELFIKTSEIHTIAESVIQSAKVIQVVEPMETKVMQELSKAEGRISLAEALGQVISGQAVPLEEILNQGQTDATPIQEEANEVSTDITESVIEPSRIRYWGRGPAPILEPIITTALLEAGEVGLTTDQLINLLYSDTNQKTDRIMLGKRVRSALARLKEKGYDIKNISPKKRGMKGIYVLEESSVEQQAKEAQTQSELIYQEILSIGEGEIEYGGQKYTQIPDTKNLYCNSEGLVVSITIGKTPDPFLINGSSVDINDFFAHQEEINRAQSQALGEDKRRENGHSQAPVGQENKKDYFLLIGQTLNARDLGIFQQFRLEMLEKHSDISTDEIDETLYNLITQSGDTIQWATNKTANNKPNPSARRILNQAIARHKRSKEIKGQINL